MYDFKPFWRMMAGARKRFRSKILSRLVLNTVWTWKFSRTARPSSIQLIVQECWISGISRLDFGSGQQIGNSIRNEGLTPSGSRKCRDCYECLGNYTKELWDSVADT